MSTTPNSFLIKNLIDYYGLTDKEAKVYLALLELGVAPVQEVARVAGINRSSAYVVLESLKKQGLVNVSEDMRVKRYIASSPEILLNEVSNQVSRREEIKEKIIEIVPELKALYRGTKQKPKTKVFEGRNGLISAFEDTLNSREKLMRVASSVKNLFKILPDYFPDYVLKRIKNGIKMRGIHPYDETVVNLIKAAPKFDEPILVPKEKYSFPADIAIYDNKIGYMSPEKGGLAIIIESKEMAEVMKAVFDLAWEEAKRLNKNVAH